MGIVYDPDTDPGAGGSHFAPSGGTSAQTYDPAQDPGVGSASTGIAAAPPQILSRGWTSLADVSKQTPEPSQTPIRDLGRVAAAATQRGSASAADTLLNPDQMLLRPAMTLGSAAYDWLAPKVGLPGINPDFRKAITEPEAGDVSQVVKKIGQATGNDPYAVIPKTTLEALTATGIEGAIPGMIFGAVGPVGAARGSILGAGGALGGAEASQFVDPKYRDAVEMLTNMAVQGGGSMLLGRPGGNVDASTARIAQTGREQGIPFSAPDITPGTIFRSPASVQATSDALQGNIIRDLGGNPATGNATTTNRITPAFLDQVRTDTGQGLETIAQNNNVGPMQTYRLLQQLQRVENDVGNVTGVTPNDVRIMRQRIAEVRQAIDPHTGTMSGTRYQGLTASDSPLADLMSDDNSRVANIGRRVMDATRDAFQSSLSPDDAAANAALRYRWRLMNTVKPLVREAQGQSIDMGGLANQILDQSQHFDLGRRDMAYTGGGQLGDYMSQARLIAGGPPPQGGAPITAPLLTPQGATAVTGPHPGVAIPTLMLQGAIEKLLGPAARSNYRTNEVFSSAMNPTTRLQRALGALGSATVP